MKNLKNAKWIIVSFVILGVIIMAVTVVSSHPFFKTPKRIMSNVIKLTPMGTHIDDVAYLVNGKLVIKNVEEWRSPTISYDSGYISPGDLVLGWPVTEGSKQSVVGHKSIRVFYSTHAEMNITIYWGFDENGKLIDVFVNKSWDMIQIGGVRRTAD